jgi:hypothetical protein
MAFQPLPSFLEQFAPSSETIDQQAADEGPFYWPQ